MNQIGYLIKQIETLEEYAEVEELWNSKNKLMREEGVSLVKHLPLFKVVGAFLNNELVATLKYHYWDNFPYYSIGALYTKSGLVNLYDFSNPNNPIPYIADFILDKLESEGYYTWYYVRTLGKAYARIQQNNHDLLSCTKLGHRYRRDIEEVILPNEISKFKIHNNLILNKQWTRPMVVVRCSLDNQYRPNGDIFNNEFNFLKNAKEITTTH
jgi:hypothetical protein